MTRSVCSPFPIQGISHEKNVPALPKASCPPIRLPGPHGHEERPRDHQSPPGGGPETSRRRRDRAQVRPPYAGVGQVAGAGPAPVLRMSIRSLFFRFFSAKHGSPILSSEADSFSQSKPADQGSQPLHFAQRFLLPCAVPAQGPAPATFLNRRRRFGAGNCK